MPSMLRKRKSQHKIIESASLRPSLSLPDITSPLLDTSTWGWDEVPPLVTSHTIYTTPSPSERNRAPSLVRDPNSPSPVQSHRPFTPWQVVDTTTRIKQGTDSSNIIHTGDFRDTARWRASGATSLVSAGRKRARGRGKVLENMNVVVVGGRGVGKTSFLNLLVKSLESEESQGSSRSKTKVPSGQQGSGERHTLLDSAMSSPDHTPASPTSPGPPVSAVLQSIGELSDNSALGLPTSGPTLRLSSRVIPASIDNHDSVQLRLVDTPGLNLSNDPVASRARERGVAGLLRLLEERFEDTLREESRIDRTKKRQEDGMIHLVLYLIDARKVLHPEEGDAIDEDVDWSCVGLFEQDETLASVPSHSRSPESRLDITEIAIIRRLSNRANVIPVLSHTDSLSMTEVQRVREAVRRDLAKVFNRDEGAGFGIFGSGDEDDHMTGTHDHASSSESDHDQPMTPVSLHDNDQKIHDMPYTIFSPDIGTTTTRAAMIRQYPWGTADVMDPRQSDFVALRSAILGGYAGQLRLQTKEKLYETYRTERLLAKRGGK